MNHPGSRPTEGNDPGPQERAAGLGWRLIVWMLVYALPPLVLLLDYAYFGPVVRFGPFIVWTAAALGMAAYAASPRLMAQPFLSGASAAILAGATLLTAGLFLVFLPLVFIASSFTLAVLGPALLGAALAYGHRWRALGRTRSRGAARGPGWGPGLVAGIILFAAPSILVQSLHDRHFARRLANLEASDPAVRSRTLKSLVGSRFCWSACTRAVCEARADLDPGLVQQVLAVNDVDLACEPGMNEWPG